MRARDWWAAVGWAIFALLLLLGLGGAAWRPGGLLLGVPTAAQVAAAVAVVAVLVVLAGFREGQVFLGLLPLVALPLSGVTFPGAAAFSGTPLLAVGVAMATLLLAKGGRCPPRWIFFPTVLLLYVVVSYRVQRQVGPEGDEPHYLMVADSILRDGDLSLEGDYAAGRYRAFTDKILAPHYRVRGKGGEIYSLHSVGLSVLVLPVYALGGYPAVSFFMALLAALLAREVRALLRDVFEGKAVGEGVAWALALSPPLLHYAGLVFTEVPAALAIAVAIRSGRDGLAATRKAAVWGVAVGCLPWLHLRYAPAMVVLALYALSRRKGARGVLLGVALCGLSAVGLALYHQELYGSFDPRVVWGRRPEFSWSVLPEGLQGLLADQEFGLLAYAPVFALCLPGFAGLLSRKRAEGVVAVTLTGVVLVMAGSWHMWRGGFNPPARFLVPLIPVLALGVGERLRSGLAPASALLLGWSLWTGLLGGWEPRLLHRDRDGTAPFFRTFSGAEEWTRLLPGYVLPDQEPDRHRRAVVWAAGLALAALPWSTRRLSAGRVAIAVFGLVGVSSVASSLSQGRTGGRDASRLVGRRAVEVPGWRWTSSADARWGPWQLGWGSVYEPHRFPAGAPIGSRLPLPSGRYQLDLDGELLSRHRPELVISPEGDVPSRRAIFDGDGLSASFEVLPGERAISLALVGGGAMTWKGVRLRASTFPWVPGLRRVKGFLGSEE